MPDNATYYYLAYGAAGAIYALYALSLWSRARKLVAQERE